MKVIHINNYSDDRFVASCAWDDLPFVNQINQLMSVENKPRDDTLCDFA